jgi:hypothetical protein
MQKSCQQPPGTNHQCPPSTLSREQTILKAQHQHSCKESTTHRSGSHVPAIPTLKAQTPLPPYLAESNQPQHLSSNRAENDVHRLRTVANAMVDVFVSRRPKKLPTWESIDSSHASEASRHQFKPGRPLSRPLRLLHTNG